MQNKDKYHIANGIDKQNTRAGVRIYSQSHGEQLPWTRDKSEKCTLSHVCWDYNILRNTITTPIMKFEEKWAEISGKWRQYTGLMAALLYRTKLRWKIEKMKMNKRKGGQITSNMDVECEEQYEATWRTTLIGKQRSEDDTGIECHKREHSETLSIHDEISIQTSERSSRNRTHDHSFCNPAHVYTHTHQSNWSWAIWRQETCQSPVNKRLFQSNYDELGNDGRTV